MPSSQELGNHFKQQDPKSSKDSISTQNSGKIKNLASNQDDLFNLNKTKQRFNFTVSDTNNKKQQQQQAPISSNNDNSDNKNPSHQLGSAKVTSNQDVRHTFKLPTGPRSSGRQPTSVLDANKASTPTSGGVKMDSDLLNVANENRVTLNVGGIRHETYRVSSSTSRKSLSSMILWPYSWGRSKTDPDLSIFLYIYISTL